MATLKKLPAPQADSASVDNGVKLAVSACRTYTRELHRYLARRLRNRQDADDLAQEVFARLLRVKNIELIRNPLAYILGIAAHVVREFREHEQHQCVVFSSDIAESISDVTEGASDGSTASPDRLELQNSIDAALRQLPPTHQVVLILVKRDGLSYQEAADKTGLSVHTIEKYLVEGRARLRVLLKGERN
jgi:RNA polymerase sigma-70 factor (ECF subfamily)